MTSAVRPGVPGPTSWVLPLYAVTMFLSAFLLFAVQPMFTRMVLPLLGGAPAVWNTAVVFFQATLLGGYLYAHLSARFLGLRRQTAVHAVVLLLAFAALPVTVAEVWLPPAEAQQIPWLLALLTVSVGLPFFAVSATAPLLQRWFAQTDHPSSDDPYFLYGGSNLGSLAALLGYPVVIEPVLGLRAQSIWWTGAYALLVTAIAVCGALLWRSRRRGAAGKGAAFPDGTAAGLVRQVGWRLRGRWLLLSFAPSALLLGVTLHISTDIAAVPLLWVVPLALYLLTFVLVFARRQLLPHRWMLAAQAVIVALVVVFFQTISLYAILFLHLAGLFVTAMVCHGELARLRPVASRLTEFYLVMSLGGVLGGLFAGILAPMLLDRVLEYPAVLVLALLLRPLPPEGARIWRWLRPPAAISRFWARFRTQAARWQQWLLDAALPVLLWWALQDGWWSRTVEQAAAWVVAAVPALGVVPLGVRAGGLVSMTIVLALVLLARRPLRFALAVVAALAVLAGNLFGTPGYLLARERTFFGVYSVNELQLRSGLFHVFLSGTTNHGAQYVARGQRLLPVTYYTGDGPVGQFFSSARQALQPFDDIAVLGLGVGSLACYARAGENITFYEIDPAVERIARDERFFSYLSDCPGNVAVRVGDGRLAIAAEDDRAFDLIVLDAFSSDAVPVHLLTREAFQLYLRKLRPDGLMLVNITNQYVDLAPVLGNLAADLGLAARIQQQTLYSANQYKLPSTWVVLARSADTAAILDRSLRQWRVLAAAPGRGVWTDDYTNIVRALRWTLPAGPGG
ncbi:MAG: fused MFS/spermidine synthase [Proteobacteria bacterium]|nr:fused MFS/spermidine synthase [Pseudomonadota bacterium]